MKFNELFPLVVEEPVFETGLLLAGDRDSVDVRRQLTRWQQAGKLYQLRRGLYSLAPPYQKINPHPFLVANRLVHGSYVSLQSALSYYSLIPEGVPVVTSVSAGRPGRWKTPFGAFAFRHIQPAMVNDYRMVEVAEGQMAYIASPEKALLDLLYLEAGSDAPAYLAELRLQNPARLDMEKLATLVEKAGKPKLQRALAELQALAEDEMEGYRRL
jgi:hypothetical protein